MDMMRRMLVPAAGTASGSKAEPSNRESVATRRNRGPCQSGANVAYVI